MKYRTCGLTTILRIVDLRQGGKRISSKLIDPNSPEWAMHGAGNWNGGGRHVSHELGFGAVDAHNAVRLAETWEAQATYQNLVTGMATHDFGGSFLIHPTIVATIRVADIAFDLDPVLVSVDLEHDHIGDLVVSLESPSGTVSILMDRPGLERLRRRIDRLAGPRGLRGVTARKCIA